MIHFLEILIIVCLSVSVCIWAYMLIAVIKEKNKSRQSLNQMFKRWLLKMELKFTNGIFIGGYNYSIVRVGKRYLNEQEVSLVNKWFKEGKIIKSGTSSVTSSGTGRTYIDNIYKWDSNHYKKLNPKQ